MAISEISIPCEIASVVSLPRNDITAQPLTGEGVGGGEAQGGGYSWSIFSGIFRQILRGDMNKRKRGDNYIAKKKTKREGMFIMTESDGLKGGEEKPAGPTMYKPEDQIYQKLHLCDYLRELYESAEEENEPPIEKRRTPDAARLRALNNAYLFIYPRGK